MGAEFNPFASPQTVIEDSVKGETDYLNRNETLENYLSLYDEPAKGELNSVKANMKLKEEPSCIDSIIFGELEMAHDHYSVFDHVGGSSPRSFCNSGDGSLSDTGANETPFQARSGEDPKDTPEMELLLEDNFEAPCSDNLFEVHSFKEGPSGQPAETPVGLLEGEREESPKGGGVRLVGDVCAVSQVGDAREVCHAGDTREANLAGDTRAVCHSDQLDDLNTPCEVGQLALQQRNPFSGARGEVRQEDDPQLGGHHSDRDLQSEMPYDECALTNGFFNTIENINTQVVQKYNSLKGVSERLIGVVSNSAFEQRIDELLRFSERNSVLIEEFRRQSEECIRRCRKFETSSEQLVGECIDTLANSSICYAEWVCLHARRVDPLEVVLSDVREFVRANE